MANQLHKLGYSLSKAFKTAWGRVFQEENVHLIDDKLRVLAEEFGVDPIDLIGHVLEFRIEWK